MVRSPWGCLAGDAAGPGICHGSLLAHQRPLIPSFLPAVALLLALTGSALAEQLKVVSISAGDTFTGLDSQNRQV